MNTNKKNTKKTRAKRTRPLDPHSPRAPPGVRWLGGDATPKQVARNIRAFVKGKRGA